MIAAIVQGLLYENHTETPDMQFSLLHPPVQFQDFQEINGFCQGTPNAGAKVSQKDDQDHNARVAM